MAQWFTRFVDYIKYKLFTKNSQNLNIYLLVYESKYTKEDNTRSCYNRKVSNDVGLKHFETHFIHNKFRSTKVYDYASHTSVWVIFFSYYLWLAKQFISQLRAHEHESLPRNPYCSRGFKLSTRIFMMSLLSLSLFEYPLILFVYLCVYLFSALFICLTNE